MKSIEELESLYDSNLISEFEQLEEKRLKVYKKVLPFKIGASIVGVVFWIATMVVLWFAAGASKGDFKLIMSLLGIVWCVFGSCYKITYLILTNDFFQEYHKKLLNLILSYKNGSITYEEKGCISHELFNECNLFLNALINFNGFNHFVGKIGITNFEFSQYTAKYEVEMLVGKQCVEIVGTIFVAHLNMRFNGCTLILPQITDGIFKGVAKNIRCLNVNQGETVKFEDEEFEKIYAVHSNDESEARMIVTKNLMEQLVQIKNELKLDIMLSLNDSKLFLVIPEHNKFKNILDAKLNKPINLEQIRLYQVFLDIAEELNLNELFS